MPTSEKTVLVKMMRQLLRDLQTIDQRGAAYYTVYPFVERYNKLLEQSKRICTEQAELLGTFDPIEPPKSSDPSQKMKTSQRVVIEISQLLTLIEASGMEEAEEEQRQEEGR